MGSFDGAVVLVTGGARGLGAAHAAGFVQEGADVVIADVLDAEGEELAHRLGPKARFCHLDVTAPERWAEIVDATEASCGPITVLINNAGIAGNYTRLVETKATDFRRVVDVNLTGAFFGIRAVAPSMRRAGGGSIINVSSVGGMVGAPTLAAYSATKWALRGLTRTAALELAEAGIRVNSVHPGIIDTPLARAADGTLEFSENIPLRRPAQAREVTDMVMFLASPRSGYSTGSEFVLDGGMLAGVVGAHG